MEPNNTTKNHSDIPAEYHFTVTPSDTNDLPVIPRALYIASGGDVAIMDLDGNTIIYSLSAGDLLPFRAKRVLSTGTSSTNIIGWY